MSNFPTTQSVGSDLQAALGQSKVQETQTGGLQHLKFQSLAPEDNPDLGGGWTYGSKAVDCTGAEVLINTQSLKHGWHLWVDGTLTNVMVPFVAALPAEPEAVKNDKGKIQQASEARELQGAMIDEDGSTFMVSYANASYGTRSAVDDLLNAIRSRAVTEPEYLYPKVILSASDHYPSSYKAGEVVFNPVFEIVAWCNQNGEEQDGEGVAALPAEAPEAEADEVVQEEAEQTTRRRRRKAS